jgi:heat shock protein HtpX
MSLTDPTSWRRHIWRNRLQTLTLLLMMAGFLALLGWLLWGVDGLWMLLFVGFLLFLFQPLVSPQQIVRLYGAQALHPEQEPGLHYLVQVLSRRAGLSRPPDLFYLPQDAINAFTVGRRDNAVVALSDGLLRSLNERELIGVLAHEISHISANDLRVMMLADGIGRLTAMLSLFGQLLLLLNLPLLLFAEASINWWAILLLIFAPHLSVLAQLGLSRMREYQADLQAARISGDAEGLAQALLKIDDLQGALAGAHAVSRSPPAVAITAAHPSPHGGAGAAFVGSA